MSERVFLIVLDSLGIGGAPDAHQYGDEGSHTLAALLRSGRLSVPHLRSLGLFNIAGIPGGIPVESPLGVAHSLGAFGRLREKSRGKDSTVGHWEIAGLVSEQPLPTFPAGFPAQMLAEFSKRTGREVLCGLPYSGTAVIQDYGKEHMQTGALIVYTSADSVFQIAAHEEVVPIEELYRYCKIARDMLTGPWAVGRVIARPFIGEGPTASARDTFERTKNRHDYSLAPPAPTILDVLAASCRDVISVGKIYDLFAGRGITRPVQSAGNREGMERTLELVTTNFEGLCFVNLVDFDTVYGHRNDIEGYAGALNNFDRSLGKLLPLLRHDDLLILTADHGCDPSTPSTDHSREDVPVLLAGGRVKAGVDLGTRLGFGCVANTIADYFMLTADFPGESLWPLMSDVL